MEKIINRLIGDAVVNVDKYINNGSTWLIFTESKQWVIELTKDGTLWYNYNFFKNLFLYMSMDVVENQHYITKWVEDNIINGVKHLRHRKGADDSRAENIIQNGVKDTRKQTVTSQIVVENTIQNGVKETGLHEGVRPLAVNNTIHNGVKQTYSGGDVCRNDSIEDTIENGVKETKSERATREWKSEQVIENGVKETKLGAPDNRDYFIEDAIQNGVKKTHRFGLGNEAEIEDAIVNGVKHTISNPTKRTYYVDNAIQNGVKNTQGSIFDNPTEVKNTIQNGIRHVEIGWAQYNNVEDVIKGGVKETKAMEEWVNAESIVDKTMRDGVKSTKPGGYLGSIEMKGKIVHQLESPKQNNEVEDVIQHGIKKTEAAALFGEESTINTVISEGIKETHDDVYHHTSRVEGVIRNGIKEVQPLPAQDGNMDWGNYYHRQEDRTKPHTQYVNDVILNGNKDTLKKSTY